MEIPIYHVDAFTDRVFSGNPAAVCPLTHWLDDARLQHIASENNLSATAFFVPEDEGYHLRWFTPAKELELCGHATLAAAFVIATKIRTDLKDIRFRATAEELRVTREGDLYALDFPSRPATRTQVSRELVAALDAEPDEFWQARYSVAVFADESHVRALRPHFKKVAALDTYAVIATAPGTSADFVSRFFAPQQGLNEDPVTGSAHCTLIPFWSQRLGKNTMRAVQLSARTGELFCEDRGDRVKIAGAAVLFGEGKIYV